MTLGRKILTIAFILLPVLLVAVYGFLQIRKQLIEHVYEERRTLASVSARVVYEKLDHLSDIGLSLSTRPVFCEYINQKKWGAAIQLMNDVPKDFPFINRVFIADTTGIVMVDIPSIKGTKNTNQSSLDWYKGVSGKWQPYLSEIYKPPETPKSALCALALPVKNGHEKLTGILVLQVNVDKLLEWSSRVNVGKTGFVYIVDQKGHIATNPDYAQQYDSVIDYSNVPAVQKALSGKSNVEVLYNPIAKENRLSAYQQVEKYGWTVIVQQQAGVALSFNQSFRFMLIFYSLNIIMAIFFAWALISEIIRRNKSEHALKRYAELIENTHVVIRNMEDEIIFWNKGMEKLYGWKREEVIGQVTHKLFSAQFPQPLAEIEYALLKNNEWHGELIHTNKNGDVVNVSSHWYLHRDKYGNPEAILETNNDITGLKKAEEKLRRSEESVRLLVENVKDYAIFQLDAEGKIISWNSGAEHIKGYKAEEIIGRHMEIFYTEEDLKKGVPRHNLEMAKQNGHYENEGWRLRKDGSEFLADVVFTALRDDAGNLLGYAKVTRDITERKKAQEQLELLSKQINQSNDSIYTLDEKFQLKSWNGGAEKLYGFTAEEAIGKNPNELLKTGITVSEINSVIEEIIEQNHWTGELKRKTKSGDDIYVHSSTTAILNNKGAVTGYIAVSFDITKEKKLRERVNQLATMVEHSSEAIITRGLDKRIITWNKGAETLFGYTMEEAVGKSIMELDFLKLSGSQITDVEKQISENNIWKTERAFFNKNGSSFFGVATGNGIKNEQGEIAAFIFIIRDISDRKQLEDELKKINEDLEAKVKERTEEIYKNERRFRSLIENSHDIISLMDQSFKIIYRSPSGPRITGWSIDELKKSDPAKIIHPDDIGGAENVLRESIANPGKPVESVTRYLNKSGKYLWMEGVVINLLQDENVNAIVFNFRDVTERVEAEKKLTASEKKFRALIENNYDMISLLDESFKIIYRSPSVYRFTGWTNEEMKNVHGARNTHPDDKEKAELIIKEVMASPGKTVHSLVRYLHKQGHYLWMEGIITNLLQDENVNAIVFNFRDVTERIEAGKKLASSELRFRSLIEHSSEGISLLDGSSNIIYRSPGAKKILGDDMGTENRVDLAYPDDIELVKNKFAEALNNPATPINYVARFLYSPGEKYVWRDITLTNFLDMPGLEAIVANFSDITEKKEAEEKIKASEEHYRMLVERSVDGIFLSDANGKYIDVNPAGCNMLGYSLEELTHMAIADVIARYEIPRISEEVGRFANGAVASSEWRFVRKDRTVFIGEVIGRMLPDGRLQAILRDITERTLAQEKMENLNIELEEKVMKRTEELQKANNEMEAFSYSVSHDLRAPLRAIIGFTNILEEDYSDKLDNEAKRITSIIKNSTSKMGHLIDDLITFSRMGRQDIIKTTIDSNKMVNEIINNLVYQKADSNIKWTVDKLHSVKADLSTLQQVWINLISNAIKYSGKATNPRIEIGSFIDKKQTVFFIKDNGVGFDEKYKNKLFKVFQRLHGSNEFEGTGIGLAIVEKIVSKHGGKVWAEAEPNKGASFYFSLPNDDERKKVTGYIFQK